MNKDKKGIFDKIIELVNKANEKTEIFKLHKEKIDVIKKHNRHYFEHDKPKISDASYDELKKEILDLENTLS